MRRSEKVAESVREELAQIVGYELDDPRVAMVTVTDVRMSKDLRDARVFVMVHGTEVEAANALRALQRAAPYVRKQLASVLSLSYAPQLHFVRDTIEERAARVDELLAKINQEAQGQSHAGEEIAEPVVEEEKKSSR